MIDKIKWVFILALTTIAGCYYAVNHCPSICYEAAEIGYMAFWAALLTGLLLALAWLDRTIAEAGVRRWK